MYPYSRALLLLQLAPHGSRDGEVGHRVRPSAVRFGRPPRRRATPREILERDRAVLEEMGGDGGGEAVRGGVDLCRRAGIGAGVGDLAVWGAG